MGPKEVQKKMKALMGVGLSLLLAGCGGAPQLFTVTIYEDEDRVVRLQTSPNGEGRGFSHPAFLKAEDIAKVMKGLSVDIKTSAISLPLLGGGTWERQPAFSKAEIRFFAPLLARGLRQATPEEVVTFYETAEISDLHQMTTSGGVFVQGDVLYVVLSNYGVQGDIWEDNEEYRAPIRIRPLHQLEPQPGRLVFTPGHFMVQPQRGTLAGFATGEPWQVGVRFKELQ